MAAAIASAAPEGAAEVLSRLAGCHDTFVFIPTSSVPFYATLSWRDGVIRADGDVANRLDLTGETLKIYGVRVPELVEATLVGRRLSEFAKLPFHCDCSVEHVESVGEDALRITLEARTSVVDCKTGRIWPEPYDVERRAYEKAYGSAEPGE